MTAIHDLSGTGELPREQRRRFIDAIFLDPSYDTVEDLWWECTHGRQVIAVRKRFIDARRCAVFVDAHDYPVYMVAVDEENCAITASTPLIDTNRIAFTKAYKRFMRTEAGRRLFAGTWSALEAADVNATRLNWAKFLGFVPTSAIFRWRSALRLVGLSGEIELRYPVSHLATLALKPYMIRLTYRG